MKIRYKILAAALIMIIQTIFIYYFLCWLGGG